MEKEHEKQQRARSDKQMEITRAANIENLVRLFGLQFSAKILLTDSLFLSCRSWKSRKADSERLW